MTRSLALISPALAVGSGFYRPMEFAFAERGWDVQVLPRRGFEKGEPRASKRHDWSYADEAQVIEDAIVAARATDPSRPVIIVGHSLGGQIGTAVQLANNPADGLVTIGTSTPYYGHYGLRAPGLFAMGVLVPAATRVAGYLPKPFFGAPGPRTLMSEWANMIMTGEMPYDTSKRVNTPSLSIHLQGDSFSILKAVRHFEDHNFEDGVLTRWMYRWDDVPEGGTTHHVHWVRKPEPVVDEIVSWWAQQERKAPVA